MYQMGELVQYGINGVCRVEGIVQGVPGLQQDIQYYLLTPVSRRDGRIYSPVDAGKLKMRRILSGEEVKELIGKVPEIEQLTIENEKQCESVYREALHSGDCYHWMRLLKTLYARRAARAANGKKVTATDERYLKNVEERLKEEFSIAIGEEETRKELEKLSGSVH